MEPNKDELELERKIRDSFNLFFVKLQSFASLYDEESVSIREDLLNFTENSKQNIGTSHEFYLKKVKELENRKTTINEKHINTINELKNNYEERLENHDESRLKIQKSVKDKINAVNEKHDRIVSTENEKLDTTQFNNTKENKEYHRSITNDAVVQEKEIESSIQDINNEILALKQYSEQKAEEIRKLFWNSTKECNDKMRERKKIYIDEEQNLRKKSNDDIHQFNSQIEENNSEFFKIQKQIINDFKHNLLACEAEYDSLYYECAGDQIMLLEKQTQNRFRRYVFEVEKNAKIKLEKERLTYENAKIKILKTDYDDELAYLIKKGNINSSFEIVEIERESGLIETKKDKSIDYTTLDHTYHNNLLANSLEIKKKAKEAFKERFEALINCKDEITNLNSQLYDIQTTLLLDRNQLERVYKINAFRLEEKQNLESIDFLDNLANMEYEKDRFSSEFDLENELIDNEKEKTIANYDHLLFKSRTEHNIEKSRIEHIIQFFESKYSKETNTLKLDISFLNEVSQKLRNEVSEIIPTIPNKAERTKPDMKRISNFIVILEKITTEYMSNKNFRFSHTVDEKIGEYLESTRAKKDNLLAEIEVIRNKIKNIVISIKDMEKEIIYLDINKNSLTRGIDILRELPDGPDKEESLNSTIKEIDDMEHQLDNKNIANHILKLRLRAYNKNLSKLENEVSKLDTGTNIFGKKESQKIFDIQFGNSYYEQFEEINKIITLFFSELRQLVNSKKDGSIRQLYRTSGEITVITRDFVERLRLYANKLYDEYKRQMKKIQRVCGINIQKEKKSLDSVVASITREKEIAIEEINSKITVIKKTANDNKIRSDDAITKYKDAHDINILRYNKEYVLLTHQYNLDIKAVEENNNDMQNYYQEAIKKIKYTCDTKLVEINKKLIATRNKRENLIPKYKNDYEFDKKQLAIVDQNRILLVSKNISSKLLSLKNEMKELEHYRAKRLREKNYHLDECMDNFLYQKKKIGNEMNDEVRRLRNESIRKLKQEKKKIK